MGVSAAARVAGVAPLVHELVREPYRYAGAVRGECRAESARCQRAGGAGVRAVSAVAATDGAEWSWRLSV